ncbi:hypothetical protein Acy02nite_49910 [Actinoplanes cyaneus]|uniref:Uncharacterized protein n=1 Tax=Actinoplanes cyaneus TaxID=52696 RepID=A0A919IJC3_9ACTN|nr:hypothetical protein [Actinoplanes cyaneus]MCW2141049.1 hypothetical protein [Actinoplanes cyaneus]GID67110.1 hypothetical protein Acy02nite_49910 [Actinoplanes cyaneus]
MRDWSYYAAAHRYDVHGSLDAERRCAALMRELRSVRDESELRRRADAGDRCAFIALLEILVDADRLDELRAMQQAGDDRAGTTLMEALVEQGREDELREEVAAGHDVMWLVDYLSERGRLDDALVALQRWARAYPDRDRLAHARRLDLLLNHGRVAEVRRAAASGDQAAVRRMRDVTGGQPAEKPDSAG